MFKATSYSVSDVRHREAFESFVSNDAQPWHRDHLGRLYRFWHDWNQAFFGQQMVPPYILFSTPSSTRALGDCSSISGFGGRLQIRIRESLMSGEHSLVRAGDEFLEGRFKFVADVLLHEMVHQYQIEVADQRENSYKGHGPLFRNLCNDIGGKLGLGTVRIAKARGKDKELPSCAHWPHCVRSASFYEGALAVEYSNHLSRFVSRDSEIAQSDRLAEVVAQLAVAAQDFARAWPVGAEEEAISALFSGRSDSKAVREGFRSLCLAAREFDNARLLASDGHEDLVAESAGSVEKQ
jgi:hypothetical protein